MVIVHLGNTNKKITRANIFPNHRGIKRISRIELTQNKLVLHRVQTSLPSHPWAEKKMCIFSDLDIQGARVGEKVGRKNGSESNLLYESSPSYHLTSAVKPWLTLLVLPWHMGYRQLLGKVSENFLFHLNRFVVMQINLLKEHGLYDTKLSFSFSACIFVQNRCNLDAKVKNMGAEPQTDRRVIQK